MPTLDDVLDRELRAATPSRDPVQLHELLLSRRRAARRRRVIGRTLLATAVLVGTLGGVTILSDAFRSDGGPHPSPATEPAIVIDEAHRIDGVPFEVCHSVAIPWASGSDTGLAFVVEEPNRAQGTCAAGYEGFQRLAIAPDGRTVTSISPRLTECLAVTGCWPAATPDLDGDGVDEIVLGVGWAPDRTSTIVLYTVTASAEELTTRRVELSCQPNKDCGTPWVFRTSSTEPISAGLRCPSHGGLTAFDVSSDGGLTVTDYTLGSTDVVGEPLTLLMVGRPQGVRAGSDRAVDLLEAAKTDADAATVCGVPFADLQRADPERASRTRAVLEGVAQPSPPQPTPVELRLDLCDVSRSSGNVDGDGRVDRLAIGTVPDGTSGCPPEGERRLVIDLASDGVVDLETPPPDCTTWCGPFTIADLDDDGLGEVLLNEDHLAAPSSAVIAVYRYRDRELLPIVFPGGANRFVLQDSWQALHGAYCVAKGQLFSTWATTELSDGTIERLTLREYRLDPEALRFELLTETTTEGSDAQLPPKGYRGYDGRFCGLTVPVI